MSRMDAKFLKDFAVKETPSGTINGSNTAFTLAQTPNENEAVQLFLDGLYLVEGVDYTLSGTSITMAVAPATAQILKAQYIRNQGE